MLTPPPTEPTTSPVPGVIPAPPHVEQDGAAARHRTPPSTGTSESASAAGRRSRSSRLLAKVREISASRRER
jgi:hypothetical protein